MPKTYVIAEAGVNHNGDINLAKQLISVAKACGADAVKFQTFKSEKLVSRKAQKAEYQKQTTDQNESQFNMIKKLELSFEQFEELAQYAKEKQITFLSTPFDEDSLHFLTRTLKLDTIKIPSGEMTNAPFLLACAQEQKKMIVSTGMCDLTEVQDALGVLAFGLLQKQESPSLQAFRASFFSTEGQAKLKQYVSLLHCTTEYPTPYDSVNLRAMYTLHDTFGLPFGLSDHTAGINIPLGATAMGAQMIEKHFTLDKNMEGPDHRASLNPEELVAMVTGIRQIEQAMGTGEKIACAAESKNKDIARKSLVALQPIQKGEKFTKENLGCKRPGNGVSPYEYWTFIGKIAATNYTEDELIQE